MTPLEKAIKTERELKTKPPCNKCLKSERVGNLLYCTVSGKAILPQHEHLCVCRGKRFNNIKEHITDLCKKCACDKVCDHNKFGFETCNNFIAITENNSKKTKFKAVTENIDVFAEWLENNTPIWFGKRCDKCTTFKCRECILEWLNEECESE